MSEEGFLKAILGYMHAHPDNHVRRNQNLGIGWCKPAHYIQDSKYDSRVKWAGCNNTIRSSEASPHSFPGIFSLPPAPVPEASVFKAMVIWVSGLLPPCLCASCSCPPSPAPSPECCTLALFKVLINDGVPNHGKFFWIINLVSPTNNSYGHFCSNGW